MMEVERSDELMSELKEHITVVEKAYEHHKCCVYYNDFVVAQEELTRMIISLKKIQELSRILKVDARLKRKRLRLYEQTKYR